MSETMTEKSVTISSMNHQIGKYLSFNGIDLSPNQRKDLAVQLDKYRDDQKTFYAEMIDQISVLNGD